MFEPGQVMHRVEFGSRDIMDAEPTFRDDLVDLLDPDISGVVHLHGATGPESAFVNREQDGVE
jgi:hypothetical protein